MFTKVPASKVTCGHLEILFRCDCTSRVSPYSGDKTSHHEQFLDLPFSLSTTGVPPPPRHPSVTCWSFLTEFRARFFCLLHCSIELWSPVFLTQKYLQYIHIRPASSEVVYKIQDSFPFLPMSRIPLRHFPFTRQWHIRFALNSVPLCSSNTQCRGICKYVNHFRLMTDSSKICIQNALSCVVVSCPCRECILRFQSAVLRK